MNNDLSPTLRALPYLLGITAVVLVGFPLGRDVDVLLRIVIGALAYFVTFVLSRFVIGRLTGRSSARNSDTDSNHDDT